jgi:hypothetical protein
MPKLKHYSSKLIKLHKHEVLKHSRFSRVNLAVFAIIFASIGGYFIYSSFAAGFAASIEPENGTVTAPATVVNDAAASGGKSVQFGSATAGSCLASNNCYPKPVNSGVGATGIPPGHTTAAGCTTTPSSGQVLNDCLFTNGPTITTTGAGATYRFSEFRGQVDHTGSGTLTVEYSNFGPITGCQNYDNSFSGSNYTVRYSRFNDHVSEGPRVAGNNILIEENFIGYMCANPGDHADGIQGYGGGTNIVIRHNTIHEGKVDVTSPIFFADNSESADVRDNLVSGGGYSLRLHDDFTPDHGPWVLIGNRIVDGAWNFGPMSNSGTTFTAQTCSDNRLVNIDASYNITSLGSVVGC